ncbi:MAG TPA: hypothetical protein VN772_02225 [Solirubrobacteraceae bacterium]|nr:hypothetical protein [Solirubrobacteraceae bacterium]
MPAPILPTQRYGRYVGLLALLILVLITINTIVTKPNGARGVPPGAQMPSFAVPLVQSGLVGAADVATRPDQGLAGRVPACELRGAAILNLCEHYERGPVVLALFVDGGSCAAILGDMQALAPDFPGVQFLAVSIKGDRGQLRHLAARGGLRFPIGIDETGTLAALYSLATCPQVTFAYPGGRVQSPALLARPAPATLRARVAALVAASRARGWRPAP